MPTPALVAMDVPPPPACYEHHNLVKGEPHLLRGTNSFLTIKESGNRLATRASEPYEEVARARGVSVACIRLNVIAIRCRAYSLIHPSAWNINSANFAFWVFSEVRARLL